MTWTRFVGCFQMKGQNVDGDKENEVLLTLYNPIGPLRMGISWLRGSFVPVILIVDDPVFGEAQSFIVESKYIHLASGWILLRKSISPRCGVCTVLDKR